MVNVVVARAKGSGGKDVILNRTTILLRLDEVDAAVDDRRREQRSFGDEIAAKVTPKTHHTKYYGPACKGTYVTCPVKVYIMESLLIPLSPCL